MMNGKYDPDVINAETYRLDWSYSNCETCGNACSPDKNFCEQCKDKKEQ